MTMIPLADRYAAAKAAFDAAEAELDALKAEIKALGREVLPGITCDVTLSLTERRTFSTTKAKSFLTAEQIAACEQVVDVHTIRIKAHGLVEVAA